jgi:hypothetical protein
MPDTHMHDDKPVEIEDIGSNPAPRETIGDLMERRLSRRAALMGLGGAAAAATLADQLVSAADSAVAQTVPMTGGPSTFSFPELKNGMSQRDAVAEGYETQTIIRWGDPVVADTPAFNPAAQTPQAQAGQFGYNCDFLDFQPLPQGSRSSDHGLLIVNHEYTDTQLMFPGIGEGRAGRLRATAEQSRIELLAHGVSVIEVRKTNGRWGVVQNSRYARRLTGETEMRISGPAAGHDLMKTAPTRPARACSARSTTAPAATRPGARSSPRKRTSTSISPARPPAAARRPRPTAATASSRRAPMAGPASSSASTSTSTRTSRTASAGTSSSTPTTHLRAGEAHRHGPLQA